MSKSKRKALKRKTKNKILKAALAAAAVTTATASKAETSSSSLSSGRRPKSTVGGATALSMLKSAGNPLRQVQLGESKRVAVDIASADEGDGEGDGDADGSDNDDGSAERQDLAERERLDRALDMQDEEDAKTSGERADNEPSSDETEDDEEGDDGTQDDEDDDDSGDEYHDGDYDDDEDDEAALAADEAAARAAEQQFLAYSAADLVSQDAKTESSGQGPVGTSGNSKTAAPDPEILEQPIAKVVDAETKEEKREKTTSSSIDGKPAASPRRVYGRAPAGGPNLAHEFATASAECESRRYAAAYGTIGAALKPFRGQPLPDSAREIALLRGDVLYAQRYYEKAATYGAMLTSLWPECDEAWAARGRAALARGEVHHHTRALSSYQAAERLAPGKYAKLIEACEKKLVEDQTPLSSTLIDAVLGGVQNDSEDGGVDIEAPSDDRDPGRADERKKVAATKKMKKVSIAAAAATAELTAVSPPLLSLSSSSLSPSAPSPLTSVPDIPGLRSSAADSSTSSSSSSSPPPVPLPSKSAIEAARRAKIRREKAARPEEVAETNPTLLKMLMDRKREQEEMFRKHEEKTQANYVGRCARLTCVRISRRVTDATLYHRVECSSGCLMYYHAACWNAITRAYRNEEHLVRGAACLTSDCYGELSCWEHFDAPNLVKKNRHRVYIERLRKPPVVQSSPSPFASTSSSSSSSSSSVSEDAGGATDKYNKLTSAAPTDSIVDAPEQPRKSSARSSVVVAREPLRPRDWKPSDLTAARPSRRQMLAQKRAAEREEQAKKRRAAAKQRYETKRAADQAGVEAFVAATVTAADEDATEAIERRALMRHELLSAERQMRRDAKRAERTRLLTPLAPKNGGIGGGGGSGDDASGVVERKVELKPPNHRARRRQRRAITLSEFHHQRPPLCASPTDAESSGNVPRRGDPSSIRDVESKAVSAADYAMPTPSRYEASIATFGFNSLYPKVNVTATDPVAAVPTPVASPIVPEWPRDAEPFDDGGGFVPQPPARRYPRLGKKDVPEGKYEFRDLGGAIEPDVEGEGADEDGGDDGEHKNPPPTPVTRASTPPPLPSETGAEAFELVAAAASVPPSDDSRPEGAPVC